MRLGTLAYFYARRIRSHPLQELLAGAGIAVGVALAFAVIVANAGVVGSATTIARGVTGSATLQLTARDDRGFDARLLAQVRQLPGVSATAPLLEQRAVLVARGGRRAAVDVASVDGALAMMSGHAANGAAAPARGNTGGARGRSAGAGVLRFRGVVLSVQTARVLGLPIAQPVARPGANPAPLSTVAVLMHGRRRVLPVVAVLDRKTLGPLASARIALMSLPELQSLASAPGRLTRILVATRPEATAAVRAALERLAAGRLTVSTSGSDVALLRQAVGASDQATGFFAAVSVLLGLLLAAGAMLLTAPERRRFVAELRIQGFARRQLVTIVLSQAILLGSVASAVGLGCGAALAHVLFGGSTGYLEQAFTLGADSTVGVVPVLVAFGGGVLACCVASVPPLADLRRRRAVEEVFREPGAPGRGLDASARKRLALAAGLAVAASITMLALVPSTALAASGLLVLATILALPAVLAAALRAAGALALRLPRMSLVVLALFALRATTLRSLALAATGAVAVFGSVAIGGAREDLLRGIGQYTSDYVGTADLWVSNDLDNQATSRIAVTDLEARVRAVPGVSGVRAYYGGFLDAWGRRVWIIARSPQDATMAPPSQMVHGSSATADRHLRAGGWVTVSDQLARQLDLRPGGTLVLPAPHGDVALRVAATTTNLGWAPGAIVMNSQDYQRAWNADAPSALEVDASASTRLPVVQRRVQSALGPGTGLLVLPSAQRAAMINASARSGLARLSQISALLLVAAVLAMAAATGASIWQRRASLAALRIQSVSPRQLWLVLLLESGVVLGVGCATGASTGLIGQYGADRYLAIATGFPVAPALASWHPVQTVLLVVLVALAVVAVPGWLASRAPVRLGLQE